MSGHNSNSNSNRYVTPSTSPRPVSPRRPIDAVQSQGNKKEVVRHNVSKAASPKDVSHASVQENNSDPRSIILDPTFIISIYHHVKSAIAGSYLHNFIELGYDHNMITIVGGSVLTLYDNQLQSIKSKYDMGHLKRYVERNTLDIDAVWFPKFQNVTWDARIDLCLTEFVKRFEILKRIQRPLPPRLSDISCVIDKHGSDDGVIHIKIKCMIDGVKEWEFFDLAIHNSFTSQTFDGNYDLIDKLQRRYIPMAFDPIYCDFSNTILLKYGEKGKELYIRVPIIHIFIRQQLFAFGNVILHTDGTNYNNQQVPRPRSEKGYIHLRRVLYIRHMLSLIQPDDVESMKALVDIGIFSITNYIDTITFYIQERCQVILHKLTPENKEIFNKKIEMIMREFKVSKNVSRKPALY